MGLRHGPRKGSLQSSTRASELEQQEQNGQMETCGQRLVGEGQGKKAGGAGPSVQGWPPRLWHQDNNFSFTYRLAVLSGPGPSPL